MQFAMPIICLSALALGSLILCMYVIGPRLNNKYWFERCIFVYGYCTGVYAIGLTLGSADNFLDNIFYINPRLCLYSSGLLKPKDIFILLLLYRIK